MVFHVSVSLPDIIGGEEPQVYLYQRIAMGVLDIIDTNTVELSKPGVRLAMKEVRYHALSLSLSLSVVFLSSYILSCPQAALTSLGIRREAQQIKKQFLKVQGENIDC